MIALTDIARRSTTAPVTSLDDLAGPGEILVLVPHPDDESLAMGAAIAAAVEAGRQVHIAIVTDGAWSHPNSASHPPDVLSKLRLSEVKLAVSILTRGKASPIWLGYPDMAAPDCVDDFNEGMHLLAPVLEKTSAIWTTWNGDPHPDHQRVWRLAKQISFDRDGIRLFACPVWGRVQEPVPNADHTGLKRFPSEKYRAQKSQAVAAHASQMTNLIKDDPDGFTMATELAEYFVLSDEIFIPS
ncbi:MAG: PIG-L family deacetylase [Nitratireductor sp.]|nr:PIG-L family deacetylase [Nitratireductor sp.]